MAADLQTEASAFEEGQREVLERIAAGKPLGEVLDQIVMNLGTNAVHALEGQQGSIDVQIDRVVLERELAARSTVLRPGTYARLVVSDTGAGMSSETVERIFDPFYTTKAPGQGTGLGLSVVHGIVRNHDGGIVVRSAPGQGTEIDVYFPIAPAAQPARPEAHR